MKLFNIIMINIKIKKKVKLINTLMKFNKNKRMNNLLRILKL